MPESVQPRPADLKLLACTRMPFGKYSGRLLLDLPEPYLIWLIRNHLPQGKLGEQLLAMYEIRLNGLEPLLTPWRPEAF